MIDFNDLISFLKNPNLEERYEIKSITSFFKLLWRSFLITLGISIAISLFISTPLRYLNLLPPLKDINFSFLSFLKISFFVPLVEELIFRLPLRISRVNLITSLGLILFLIFQNLNIYVSLSFLIVSFGFIILIIINRSDILPIGGNFFTKYYLFIFYSQAILFGLLHLPNYNLDLKYFYLFPLFIIIYILIGCLWGYIRVRFKYGIYACIITHMIVNSLYYLILAK